MTHVSSCVIPKLGDRVRPFRPDDAPLPTGAGSRAGDPGADRSRPGTDEGRALRPGYLWLPVLGWMAFIFYLSSRPDLRFSSDSSLDFAIRKAGHMGVFGILALLFWAALQGWPAGLRPWPDGWWPDGRWPERLGRAPGLVGRSRAPGSIGRLAASAGAWALVLTALYASTDEFHQTLVRGRHGSVLDVAIDSTGAVIALVGTWWVGRRIGGRFGRLRP